MPGCGGATTTRRPSSRTRTWWPRTAGATTSQPEYELLDTGVFDDDRYWVVEVVHAKADPHDLLMEISVTNAGPEESTLHVLPHLWFRNTWSWDVGAARPVAAGRRVRTGSRSTTRGSASWPGSSTPVPDGSAPRLLFCDNDTNRQRLYGSAGSPAYPKDGINDHVVAGAPTVNPDGVGTKCAAWYQLTVAPGETQVVRVRLRPPSTGPAFGPAFDEVLAQRRAEADEFYAEVIPAAVDDDARLVARQAFAGMIWGKQFYCYDVKRWLDGDPTQPPPPPERRRGRNAGWLNVDARDILSMPDPWEYPWFAAWDLAFHTVALAHLDPAFAKYQLLAMCREWFQNPNGALPAYEWAFGDVNPPVHAWAALHVWDIDGRRDTDFLARLHAEAADELHLVGQPDGPRGRPPVRRRLPRPGQHQRHRPVQPAAGRPARAGRRHQLDGVLLAHAAGDGPDPGAEQDDAWTDIEVKFIEHFVLIVDAMHSQGLWDEEDGFFYDVFRHADGTHGADQGPVHRRACCRCWRRWSSGPDCWRPLGTLQKRFAGFLGQFDPDGRGQRSRTGGAPHARDGRRSSSASSRPAKVRRVLARVFDEDEFLSPYGLRALSKYHQDHPCLRRPRRVRVVRSTTSPASRAPGCSAATPTGAARCGCRSTTCVLRNLQRYARSLGDARSTSSTPPAAATCSRAGRRAPRTCAAA